MQSDFPARLPIPPATARISATPPSAPAETLRALVPPGAVVEAQVLRLTAARASQAAYEVLLSIGGRAATVASPRALAPGSRVWITSDDGARLQLLTSPPAPAGKQAALARIDTHVDQALRNALPREQPVKPALRALQSLLTSPEQPLTEPGRALLREVFARLPDLAGVSDPQRLPALLRASGVFLESSLQRVAEGTARPALLNDDLRVSLLRLAAHVRSRLPDTTSAQGARDGREAQLLELVQTVLARVKVQQLSTLNARLHNQAEAPAIPRASLELAFLHGAQIEAVQLQIGRENVPQRAREAAAEPAWTADLDFELGELGALHVRARLQAAQLSATFWAPAEATLALVKRHVVTLREELARHEVHLQHVAYQRGSPPTPRAHPRPLLHVAI